MDGRFLILIKSMTKRNLNEAGASVPGSEFGGITLGKTRRAAVCRDTASFRNKVEELLMRLSAELTEDALSLQKMMFPAARP